MAQRVCTVPPIYATCLRLESTSETAKARDQSGGARGYPTKQYGRHWDTQSSCRELDLVKARHGKAKGGGGIATKVLANGECTGVGLASIANRDDEGAHATIFSLADQASHDKRDLVVTGGCIRG